MAESVLPSNMREIFKDYVQKLLVADKREVFAAPVNVELNPRYLTVVTTPMDLGTVLRKLEDGDYDAEFHAAHNDVDLTFANCMLYNEEGTIFHKEAKRIKGLSDKAFRALMTPTMELALQWQSVTRRTPVPQSVMEAYVALPGPLPRDLYICTKSLLLWDSTEAFQCSNPNGIPSVRPSDLRSIGVSILHQTGFVNGPSSTRLMDYKAALERTVQAFMAKHRGEHGVEETLYELGEEFVDMAFEWLRVLSSKWGLPLKSINSFQRCHNIPGIVRAPKPLEPVDGSKRKRVINKRLMDSVSYKEQQPPTEDESGEEGVESDGSHRSPPDSGSDDGQPDAWPTTSWPNLQPAVAPSSQPSTTQPAEASSTASSSSAIEGLHKGEGSSKMDLDRPEADTRITTRDPVISMPTSTPSEGEGGKKGRKRRAPAPSRPGRKRKKRMSDEEWQLEDAAPSGPSDEEVEVEPEEEESSTEGRETRMPGQPKAKPVAATLQAEFRDPKVQQQVKEYMAFAQWYMQKLRPLPQYAEFFASLKDGHAAAQGMKDVMGQLQADPNAWNQWWNTFRAEAAQRAGGGAVLVADGNPTATGAQGVTLAALRPNPISTTATTTNSQITAAASAPPEIKTEQPPPIATTALPFAVSPPILDEPTTPPPVDVELQGSSSRPGAGGVTPGASPAGMHQALLQASRPQPVQPSSGGSTWAHYTRQVNAMTTGRCGSSHNLPPFPVPGKNPINLVQSLLQSFHRGGQQTGAAQGPPL